MNKASMPEIFIKRDGKEKEYPAYCALRMVNVGQQRATGGESQNG
jgi:hypothetical protein